MPMGKKTLRFFLKKQREKKGLSIRALAKYSDVSDSFLSQIELGKRFPSAKVLRKLARPLGVKEEILMREAGYLPEMVREESAKYGVECVDVSKLSEEDKRLVRDMIVRLEEKREGKVSSG
ncbi:helix-turn-helix transcriptional regulator [Candidatus Oleimmundimicrobium sp.]|uniref:helix-turn-helix domain-containing protein n=1 Tax=Candidatus Oleimmundimicrobium sp. TaxID=3060597 RepID=UPI002722AF1E|nr:helix-turn-helix transcriptional regulator [Candidatus Oleimmundimicrobium sp.]MDO8886686.1 helix-turn-helix transcriptional regulator [Candidatus Oleimmundimicrobium sp.]